jgi:bifunctional non-homologous end joining protein LigD
MQRKPPAKKPSPLEDYRAKRDFSRTSEPAASSSTGTGDLFVVQEHHARSHHFDLRLEIEGVLVSWAVPKGIPEHLDTKRLAVRVEDHPLEYAGFEGRIPSGSYGAGDVAIWDTGTWSPLDKTWKRTFAKGKLKFRFHGERLKGPYLLARMKDDTNWLLRKLDPGTHPDPQPETRHEPCAFVAPQLSRAVSKVPAGLEWVHEIKLDGYRLIAVRVDGMVKLYTRNHHDWTDRFTTIAGHLGELPGGDFVLDGEAVAFDEKGRSSFGRLQAALKDGHGDEISYVVFDLLNSENHNLQELPLSSRFQRLEKLIPDGLGPIRLSKTWPGDAGIDLFKQCCVLGLEGIISKRMNDPYQPGSRSGWLKSKCRPRQEFVICGYTSPKGACEGFGALVLGSFEGGRLVPRGKVGTGFSDKKRRDLVVRMDRLRTTDSPFDGHDKDVTWVEPALVAEIEFAEITRDGSIRQGSFIGLREDKPATEVRVNPTEAVGASSRDSEVAGVVISHPDRVVFPDSGVTKIDLARYYERVEGLILPHLVDRPLALLRAPEGLEGQLFFQKNFRNHVPDHVKVSTLDDGTEVIHVDDISGVISLVQHGVIEFHPWGAKLSKSEKPDLLIWDLDPDKEVAWKETLGTAFLLRDFLADHGLDTVVKTSGGKGLHVMLPIKRRHTWEVLKPFTRAVAARVADFSPDRLTIASSLKRRKGKIYIDWLRNGRGSTCVAPWSVRARPGAKISLPQDWSDLDDIPPQGYTINEPLRESRDWAQILPQSVPIALIREFV